MPSASHSVDLDGSVVDGLDSAVEGVVDGSCSDRDGAGSPAHESVPTITMHTRNLRIFKTGNLDALIVIGG